MASDKKQEQSAEGGERRERERELARVIALRLFVSIDVCDWT